MNDANTAELAPMMTGDNRCLVPAASRTRVRDRHVAEWQWLAAT